MATGPTHAMSGLAVWAGLSIAGIADGFAMTPQTWTVGAILTSGAALLPDLDHPEATVAHTFGPVTHLLSKGVHAMSHGIYRLTRTSHDANRHGGHRGMTHTLVFAVLCGLGTMTLVQAGHKYAVAALLFLFCALAVRGLLHEWTPRGHVLGIIGISLVLTIACWHWLMTGPPEQAQWCAIAVASGCLAHCLGDCITEQGCPVFWPLPLNRKTWYPVGLPKPMRMRTGGAVELRFVLPLLTIAGLWLTAAALQRTGFGAWVPVDLLTLQYMPNGIVTR